MLWSVAYFMNEQENKKHNCCVCMSDILITNLLHVALLCIQLKMRFEKMQRGGGRGRPSKFIFLFLYKNIYCRNRKAQIC